MSRIGKSPITIPAKVKVTINGTRVGVEGPKGKLEISLPEYTSAVVDGSTIRVARSEDSAAARARHGLARALVNNMVRLGS